MSKVINAGQGIINPIHFFNQSLNISTPLLTISGEKKVEKEDKGNNYYICERSAGSFYRTIQIPTAVDENNIDAKMKEGVLKITLPKSAEALAHAKQIDVKKA